MAKKRGNFSQERIKIHILAYQYRKGQTGANAYVIMHKANLNSQDHTRLRELLDELCSKSFLDKNLEETSGEKGRMNYRITQSGQELVDRYRDPLIQRFHGLSIEDLLQDSQLDDSSYSN